MENSGKQIAAFFDLDLTITSRDSFRYFLRKQYLYGYRNWHFIPQVFFFGVMRKMRFISLQTFKEQALVSLTGKSRLAIKYIGIDAFDKYLRHIIRPQAELKLKLHKQNGHLVFLATSSPDIYISSFAEHFNLDGYVCSKLYFNENRFAGKFDGRDCWGIEKVRRLRKTPEFHNIDLSKSYAYSDNESDLPLLEFVGKPVAVCPTPELRKIAMNKKWTIENW